MVSRSEKMPRPFTPAGAFPWQHSVSADVHKTQSAPGVNVPVAIAADVEGRAAEEMTMTMVAVVAMTVMSAVAVAVTTMAVTTMTMTAMSMTTASRSRGHRGGTEGDRGNDGE